MSLFCGCIRLGHQPQQEPKRWYVGVFGFPEAAATDLIEQLYNVYKPNRGRTETNEEKEHQRNDIWELIFENFKHVVEKLKPDETKEYERLIKKNWKKHNAPMDRLAIFNFIKRIYSEVGTDEFKRSLDGIEQLDLHIRLLFADWSNGESEMNKMLTLANYRTINQCARFIPLKLTRGIPKRKNVIDFMLVNRLGTDHVDDLDEPGTTKSVLIVVPVDQGEADFVKAVEYIMKINANANDDNLRIDVFAKYDQSFEILESPQFLARVKKIEEVLQYQLHTPGAVTKMVSIENKEEFKNYFDGFLDRLIQDPRYKKFLNV